MTKALIITSSALADASVSSRLTGAYMEQLRKQDPKLEIVVRDIGANPIPHLTADTVSAIRGTAQSDAERALSLCRMN